MVQTALYDPIVVEPRLTAEKIRELLERGAESAKLDYKSEYDPSNTDHKVRLVKHILAMANTAGGYIVIGVEDDGTRRGLASTAAERIDEAIIRSQVAGYTSTQIPIFSANSVDHDGQTFAIVTVLPLAMTVAVANAEGNSPGGNLFRKGDVLVRHGSASERWSQADADFMLQRIANARKEEWLREFGSDLNRLIRVGVGRDSLEIDETAFDLSAEDFQKLVIRLLRKPNG
jgi:predicted HTH transcriptional regulator